MTDRPTDPGPSERVVAQDGTGQEYLEARPSISTPGAHPDQEGGVDRGMLILEGLRGAAAWAWRFLLVIAALAVLFYLVGKLWVGVLPLILALIVSTVLWPPVRFLTRRRWPAGLASMVVLLLALGTFLGSLAAIAPGIVSQGQDIVSQASEGVQVLRDQLEGPPFNLQNEQVSGYLDQASTWLQDQASNIASGVLSGVATAGSLLVTLAMVLVLTFFFLKDGVRFLPWLRRFVGPTAGLHLTETLSRMWTTLGGFIRAQALVALVDAVAIGIGLLILGVPLAFGLALITFFASFIPIVGAIAAGALAVLVALVSVGFGTALWVLVLILLVQQLEGNVLQPILQSRAMDLHPVIILLAVAAGGTIWGIVGAFLAVPVTATAVSAVRYASEHLDLRAGTLRADEVRTLTPEGARAVALAEESAPVFRLRAQEAHRRIEEERDAARSGPALGAASLAGAAGIAAALKERVMRTRPPWSSQDSGVEVDPDPAASPADADATAPQEPAATAPPAQDPGDTVPPPQDAERG
ncbi:AI-2E family transporter [Ornithinimicrobium pekingense]|uniref:Permease n=1 Tax=Ornithinimicrobium pekingense TaxID=384677 RepID=A0ABQ2FAQ2_9MICO|nr:AI-2E family transporter [Ornithinimicrobium pekingense]GGK75822.1 permease [Ornithinimicrobium pekingense]